MEKETIKTIALVICGLLILGSAVSYFSFKAGQNSKLEELANNGEFSVKVPVGNDTSVTELRTLRLQDFFVTTEAHNKLYNDCQATINQLTGR